MRKNEIYQFLQQLYNRENLIYDTKYIALN